VTDWRTANQQHLMAAVADVRTALERHVAVRSGDPPPTPDEIAPEWTLTQLPALQVVCETFGLSAFERDVLVLCAGVELQSSLGQLCATAHGDPRCLHPTFSLVLAALDDPHWSAVTPTAPLRYWRLVDVGSGDAMTTSPLRIDERILHFLTGDDHVDEQLHALIAPVLPPAGLPASHAALAERIIGHWSDRALTAALPLVELCGAERGGKRAIAATACATIGMRLFSLPAELIPSPPAEQESLRRTWAREAALSGGALLVDAERLDTADSARIGSVCRFLERLSGAAIVTARDPLGILERPALRLQVEPPPATEQRQVWQQVLGPRATGLNGTLDALSSQFKLDITRLRAVAIQIAHSDQLELSNDELKTVLWDACREQARARLDDLAQRIEPSAAWDDLVLPEQQLQMLREIALHVRHQMTVYETWGFAARSGRGLAISALFAGASGTGKTMAAEVLAGELRLDLYRIDLSSVVSKYIGETEKNLRRVFDAAEESGAILLFDEADALFGKRSEVKDSHDRYANIEVSYLLQRMEAYRGLAILTTNLKSALDQAFMRRLRFVVHFPFPDADQRADIWRRIFPERTPTRDLQVAALAQLNVAGGNIRNIAVNAAFLAAGERDAVTMRHVLAAARGEYTKLEKVLTEAEIGNWT
jgi:ATP-dependent 26S proteasome regulatory subunit